LAAVAISAEARGASGTTALLAVEYEPVPFALIPATRNRYDVPGARPETVCVVDVLEWKLGEADTQLTPPVEEYCTS